MIDLKRKQTGKTGYSNNLPKCLVLFTLFFFTLFVFKYLLKDIHNKHVYHKTNDYNMGFG